MKEGDANVILDHEELKRSFPELVNKRRKLVKANIPNCYVAVTDDDTPCYLQWLMGPEQNERIQSFFGKAFPKLDKDEALLEGAFANPAFRGMGVMPEAMSKITTEAVNIGVHRVITFVSIGNIPSLKGCKRAGFSPYVLKKDRRFLFQHKVSFHAIPDDMLSAYHEATGGRRKRMSIKKAKMVSG
ncbi:MAG TPA: GNAT family protein [Balneolaceae bacterium]